MAKIQALGYAENSVLMGQWQHGNLRYTNRHARRRFNIRKRKGTTPSQRFNRAFVESTRNSKQSGLDSMKQWLKENNNVS